MREFNYGRFISVYQSQVGDICITTIIFIHQAPSVNLCLVPTEVELALNTNPTEHKPNPNPSPNTNPNSYPNPNTDHLQ